MNWTRIKAAAVISLLALMPAAAQESQQKRISLKFSPGPGTVMTYGIQARMNGDGKNLLGKSIQTEVRAQGDVSFSILASPPDSVRAALTVPAIDVNARMADKDIHGTIRTRQGGALEVIFNSTGKISEVRNPDVIEQDFTTNIGFTQIMNDYFPVLPSEPVSVGDTWSDTRTIHIPFSGFNLDIVLRTDYRLDDILPSMDGPTAFITTTYSASVSGRTPLEGGAGIFEGKGGGTGYLHFLPEKGIFTGFQTSFSVQAGFSVKKGNDVLLSWPFSFDSYSLISLNGLETR